MAQDDSHAQKSSVTPNELGAALRNGRILVLLFACLVIVFVYGYIQRAQTAAEVQSEIQEMESMIESAHLRTAELEAELDYASSEDFLDKIAREELGLAKPGETALVLLDAPAELSELSDPVQNLDVISESNSANSANQRTPDTLARPSQSPQSSAPQTAMQQGAIQPDNASQSSPAIWQTWLDLFTSSPR